MPVHIKRVSGIVNYSYEVDGPADHALIPESAYFKDLSDGLIYFKNSLGAVKNTYDLELLTVGPTKGRYANAAAAIADGVESFKIVESFTEPATIIITEAVSNIEIMPGVTWAFADGAHLITTQADTKVHIYGGGSLTYLDTGYGLTFGGAKVDLTATTADVTVNAVLYSTTGQATLAAAALNLMNAVAADPLVRAYQDNPGVDTYFYAVPATTTAITVVAGVDTTTSGQAPADKWVWYRNLSGNGYNSILKFTNISVSNLGTGIFGSLMWLMTSVALQLEDCHFTEESRVTSGIPYGFSPFHKY